MLVQKRKRIGDDMEPCFRKLFLANTNSDKTNIEFAKKNSEKEKLHLSGLFLLHKLIKLLDF